ncbi:MAG TPA: 4-hydroxythreonine-4-phosphate dehydrogenase PdxA [Polyangiaceae bacterium]|jgi:4-hydroxythreonine-4-phosphate dehydrogenase|nr:4-hydroxythreonine-4-phosphate dehydrogenase PdxA [Polyangiaceae bacterium]
MTLARVVISMGCPCGIGPEVSVVAAQSERAARVLLVGDLGAVLRAVLGRGVDPARVVAVAEPAEAWGIPRGRIAVWQPTRALAPRDRKPGAPTRMSGAAQLAWIDAACDEAARGQADALVTGPVSKEAIVGSGAPGSKAFLGHTEHLQARLRAREVVMAFWSPRLVTSLATTHVPLARVPRAVTPTLVARATYWLGWLLMRVSGDSPRLAVAALNPHAGEGGLLGREEKTRIVPGIVRARARLRRSGIDATVDGPIPAESAFRLALARRWDGVVAMYHDQATIPMKLAGFGEAVNVSLGLPIVRTSVDHGTAYDRAGTWTADADGMQAAIALAARLVNSPGSA